MTNTECQRRRRARLYAVGLTSKGYFRTARQNTPKRATPYVSLLGHPETELENLFVTEYGQMHRGLPLPEIQVFTSTRSDEDELDLLRRKENRIEAWRKGNPWNRRKFERLLQKKKANVNPDCQPAPGEIQMKVYVNRLANRLRCGSTKAWKLVKDMAKTGNLAVRRVHAGLIYVREVA